MSMQLVLGYLRTALLQAPPKIKKQVVELESPGCHWSDWPVLGAAIPIVVKGPAPKKEGLKSVSKPCIGPRNRVSP
jgi:hypothetical protein